MTGWADLEQELAIWRQQGLTLPLWWRDDDAIAPTPALDQLLQLSDETGLPVHLAVIPEGAIEALAERLQGSNAIPVVHGFAHINHAPEGRKKMEFGTDRPLEQICEDIETGLHRLQNLFGPALAPLFVPPWNRIAPEVLPLLQQAGYRGLSTFTPRQHPEAVDGLAQINTHIDPIDWHNSRSAHPAEMLLAQMLKLLQDRRYARTDNTEPLGLLTHHLAHDSAIWNFTARLIITLMAGPVSVWSAHSLKGSPHEPTG